MKNIILALLLVFGLASLTFAGDCSNGLCRAPIQPVRKAVTITKNIIVAPVRVATSVLAPRSCCETAVTNDTCNCGCSSSTREVVKYQPLRRRFVNRTVNVTRTACQ